MDPNEPTYCLCNQVSFGEMVACDHPDVCDALLFMVILPCWLIISDAHRLDLSNFAALPFSTFLTVQDRVVSFWMCWFKRATEGEVVLP